MRKPFHIPLLFGVFLIFSAGMYTSCKKDNNGTNSGQVQLLSYGPTGAKVGDTVRFIGNNLNLVTEVDFTGKNATVAQSAFIQQRSDLILLKVPQQVERGYVTLKTAQGNIV